MGLADRPLASAVSISSVFVMNVLDPRRCCIKLYTQQASLLSLQTIGKHRKSEIKAASHAHAAGGAPNTGNLQCLWREENVV